MAEHTIHHFFGTETTFWKDGIDELLVSVFLESKPEPSAEIVLDVDTTDLPIHGQQEGRFFHGYYDA